MSGLIQPINESKQLASQPQEAKEMQENKCYCKSTCCVVLQQKPIQRETNGLSSWVSGLIASFSQETSREAAPLPILNFLVAGIKAAEAGEAIARRHLNRYSPHLNLYAPVSQSILSAPNLTERGIPRAQSQDLLKRKREEVSAPPLKYAKKAHSSTLSIESLERKVRSCLNSTRLTLDERKELAILIIRKEALGLHDRAKLQQVVLDNKSRWKKEMLKGGKQMINEMFLEIRGNPNFWHLNSESVEKKEARIRELTNKF